MMCKDITIMQEIPTNHMQHTKILLIKENNTKQFLRCRHKFNSFGTVSFLTNEKNDISPNQSMSYYLFIILEFYLFITVLSLSI